MKLEDWRKEIDAVDLEILSLIRQRTVIVREIGVLKAQAGLPIIDLNREKEVLKRISEKIGNLPENKSIVHIFKEIIRESRQIQIKTIKEISTRKTEAC